ncbi:MAG: GerAB/ArcD/ProY family transporter [Clostridia bacterium]|nr:GerAB/ArcD/ProY family transporter [Clostridia bacterium]
MGYSKLNTIEAIMAIFTIIVAHTILSLQRNILALTKSATIINLIYVSLIAILIAYFIFKLLTKFPGLDLIDISEFLGGKLLKNIIGFIFISFFTITCSLLLRSFCESLKVIYFPLTDVTYIILIFLVALALSNRLNFTAPFKANTLIMPIVFVSIIFLMISNINNFTPERIFPIFGDGIKQTFGIGIVNLYSFSGIVYLYFLPPLLKEPKDFKKISLISISICAIYLTLCVAILLFMFSFLINTNEILPLYNATRYISFGNFFQRLESIFLLLWILAFAGYLSIIVRTNSLILKKLLNIENPELLNDIFRNSNISNSFTA